MEDNLIEEIFDGIEAVPVISSSPELSQAVIPPSSPDLSLIPHHEEVVSTSNIINERQAESGFDFSRFKAVKRKANFAAKKVSISEEPALKDLNIEAFPQATSILDKDPSLASSLKKLVSKTLSKNTLSGYGRVWKSFKQFCEKFSYETENISQLCLVHYIAQLEKDKVGLSFFSKLMPALKLHTEMLGLDFSIKNDAYVLRLIEAAKRSAAERKKPTKKAKPISVEILTSLIKKYISPYVDNVEYIQASAFRSIYRATIQYFSFCRFDCFNRLLARDVKDLGDCIELTFTSCKNDQFHKGSSCILVSNQSEFCPVKLTRLYFERFGLKLNDSSDNSPLNFNLVKSQGPTNNFITRGKGTVSYSAALKETRNLLQRNGFDTKGYSEKSPKVSGVTNMLENGASLEACMWHGRWRALTTPNHYKVSSLTFRKMIASQVPHNPV